MREIITASSAAGVAVAFGSPIGGVLFALEVSTSSTVGYARARSTIFAGNDSHISSQDNVAQLFLCISCDSDFSRESRRCTS